MKEFVSNETWHRDFQLERVEEVTILQIQGAMKAGRLTAKQLVEVYLYRIALWDKRGPNLNSILEINPDALHIAEAMDMERATSGPRGPLHGVPVLLKDNVNTADKMHTSGGSLALQESFAVKDAFIVQKLRAAGAVILGKANMTELANFMAQNMPSGYSSRGGQVLNPYGPGKFDVGGSSSGSAAAVAANFAMVAIGTETSGSILNPSVQNSIVGIKPTVGLVSRSGIMPISFTQDTAGPMARTVQDAAILLGALTGQDDDDPATWTSAGRALVDYTTCLEANGLRGARIGVCMHGASDASVEPLFRHAIDTIQELGANVVNDVHIPSLDALQDISVLTYEFKPALNAYLRTLHADNGIRSLQDIIEYNQRRVGVALKYGQHHLVESQKTSGTLTDPLYIESKLRSLYLSQHCGIDRAMREYQLDAILFAGDEGCDIAARAGYPSVTVPSGYKLDGEPFGVTFTGGAYTEPVLIRCAYAYEQATKHRVQPRWAGHP